MSTSGRIVLSRADALPGRAFINGRATHGGFDVDDATWAVASRVFVLRVTDVHDHARALDLVLRGADVVAEVSAEREPAVLDDLERIGVTPWEPPSDELDGATIALLGELASGETVSGAARRCNLSVRDAHRRLATARNVVGASTNAELIAAGLPPSRTTT